MESNNFHALASSQHFSNGDDVDDDDEEHDKSSDEDEDMFGDATNEDELEEAEVKRLR